MKILGMTTLHTWDPPILHRDMKSLNLLVNLQFLSLLATQL